MQYCSEYDVEEDMNRIWGGVAMGSAWRERYQSHKLGAVQYSVYDESLSSLDKPLIDK